MNTASKLGTNLNLKLNYWNSYYIGSIGFPHTQSHRKKKTLLNSQSSRPGWQCWPIIETPYCFWQSNKRWFSEMKPRDRSLVQSGSKRFDAGVKGVVAASCDSHWTFWKSVQWNSETRSKMDGSPEACKERSVHHGSLLSNLKPQKDLEYSISALAFFNQERRSSYCYRLCHC